MSTSPIEYFLIGSLHRLRGRARVGVLRISWSRLCVCVKPIGTAVESVFASLRLSAFALNFLSRLDLGVPGDCCEASYGWRFNSVLATKWLHIQKIRAIILKPIGCRKFDSFDNTKDQQHGIDNRNYPHHNRPRWT